uniref:hypothetical protein n=1 Tax=uncultured Erythrobacter sp. TaxID=263913 RepID=UPI00260E132B|nr:hypothetical protein [uncultured Erythrobacter sp.]
MYQVLSFLVRTLLICTIGLGSATQAENDQQDAHIPANYSEAVDLFITLDNVSGWWDGFVDPAYRSDWERRFGWTAEDQAWADRYSEYRHRTYADPSQTMDIASSPHGLFSARTAYAGETDPLATFMVDQPNVETAIENLGEIANADDVNTLRGFYIHFEDHWRQIQSENGALSSFADKLEAQLSGEKLDDYLSKVSTFYGVKRDGNFRVFFTRFPLNTRSRAEIVAGRNLILHAPIDWKFEDGEWDTIVAHEIVHYVSSLQNDEQKRSLTDRFLARCPTANSRQRLSLLEEPLAVAVGQVGYSEQVLGKPLEPLSNWYGNPRIDITARSIAKSILNALKKGIPIAKSSLVEEAALLCDAIAKIENHR